MPLDSFTLGGATLVLGRFHEVFLKIWGHLGSSTLGHPAKFHFSDTTARFSEFYQSFYYPVEILSITSREKTIAIEENA